MPFIKIQTNMEIDDEQEEKLKRMLGEAIESIPGKSEEYLLIKIEDHCRMYLRGDRKDPIVYIEASIFGNEGHRGFDIFAKQITQYITSKLQVPIYNIYINFEDISSWSSAGQFIDRRMYL